MKDKGKKVQKPENLDTITSNQLVFWLHKNQVVSANVYHQLSQRWLGCWCWVNRFQLCHWMILNKCKTFWALDFSPVK